LSRPISGTVSTVYPYLDATTRSIKARIDLNNSDLNLKPDMYADVLIKAAPVEGVLSIPLEAVLFTGKRETVFVDLGAGRFEPRTVSVGLQGEDGFVEILRGIAEGERVVTSAQFMFDSESKLREAVDKMRNPDDENEGDPEELF
jgi:Cu(I)/Ag(I) efflux system membrane fusion protein/cobalt-zinc-cadmium efflux system membrane fusion protein